MQPCFRGAGRLGGQEGAVVVVVGSGGSGEAKKGEGRVQ